MERTHHLNRCPTIRDQLSGLLAWAESPRWEASSSGTDGGYVIFTYDSTGRVTHVQQEGVANIIAYDGSSSSYLQPNQATGNQNISTTTYTYNAGYTDLTDSYGHSDRWFYDKFGEVTQTQYWYKNSSGNTYFATKASWDNSRNLVESVDPNGNPTDFGYDTHGNIVWVQEPQVSTSGGTGRPVARYTFDANNNLVAACDPQYIWNSGASSCTPGVTGVTTYTYTAPADGSQPYGQLTQLTAPNGYKVNISYDPSSQGGYDFGLPTRVQGATAIPQNGNTTRTPTTTMTYDQRGNLASNNTGSGTWTFQYNAFNQVLVATDPDNGSSGSFAAKGALATSSYACYYPNGQVAYTETAAQHAADGGSAGVSNCAGSVTSRPTLLAAVSYVYDADGNAAQETHHFGCASTSACTAGVATRWYDALDRLVEVQMPQDPSDIFQYWLTRYDYDNSDSSTSGVYGNLAAVQRYVPGPTYSGDAKATGSYQWLTTQSWGYDALDRVLNKSYYSPGATAMSMDNWVYDVDGNGLLAWFSNANGDTVRYSYDAMGHVIRRDLNDNSTSNLYAGGMPSEEMTYDADGRVHSYNNDESGMAFYTYNADGTIQRYSEPNAVVSWTRPTALGTVGPLTPPNTYQYSYYADGMLQQLATTDGKYSQQYSYRTDGLLEEQTSSATWPQAGATMSASYTWDENFTAAGRMVMKTDVIHDTCPAGQTCAVTMDGQTHPALRVAYDQFGRYETWTIPSGAYGNFAYDFENEPTSLTTTPTLGQTTGVLNLTYSTRGELLNETDATAQPIASFKSADGFMYSTLCTTDGPCPTESFDTRSSTLLSSRMGTGPTMPTIYTYDAAGRRSGGRQYDALNRLVKYKHAYAYGPGTIPTAIDNITEHAPLGLTPVLATQNDSTNPVVDVKFGMNSEVLPTAKFTGLTVYDRDPFGFVATQRNSTGTSGWAAPNPYAGCGGSTTGGTSGFVSVNGCVNGAQLYPNRTDGYYDGSLTFRGVRAYDSDTLQWSTPDAYSGDAANPITSLGYNYANNNPAVFADPSGFDSTPPPCLPGCTPGMPSSGCGTVWARDGDGWNTFHISCGGDILDENGGIQGSGPDSPESGKWDGRCVQAALANNAVSLGLDAVGMIPVAGSVAKAGGVYRAARGVMRLVGSQFGHRGIVAIQQGGLHIRGAVGALGMAAGAGPLADGETRDAALSMGTAAVSLLKASPVVGNFISAGSLLFDVFKTGVAIAKCRR